MNYFVSYDSRFVHHRTKFTLLFVQFMWGFFVEYAGVGPKACPVNQLTAEKLATALADLASPTLQSKATKLSLQMGLEDGIQGGYVHFMDCLPRENMLCDVSLLLGETVMARYELVGARFRHSGVKVSSEVAALLEMENTVDLKAVIQWVRCPTRKTFADRQVRGMDIRRHAMTNYNLSGHIRTFRHGCMAAFWGLIFGVLQAISQFYWKADRWARSQGAFGCLFGLAISPFYTVTVALIAVLIFFDRLAVGITNGCFRKNYDYIFDPSWKAKVHNTPAIAVEKESFLTNGISKARRIELHQALDIVVKARFVYERCKPKYPEGHMHFMAVKLSRLAEVLKSEELQRDLCLSSSEVEKVLKKLDKNSLPTPHSVHRSMFFATSSIPSIIGGSGTVDASDLTKDSMKKLSTDNSSGFLSLSDHASKAKEVVAKMNPMNFLTRKKAEETEISFSHFIQALQTVAAEKCLHVSRRRSAISVTQFDPSELEEFSEYMH